MKLDIYAGKKKMFSLVRWFGVGVDGKLQVTNEEKWAIPGRHVATEKTVREWAKDMGYSVQKKYELEDRDENLSVS
jgi:hypothetical protein